MGCDCDVYLPPDVCADHIAAVVAILTGSKATEYRIRGSNGLFTNISPEATQEPQMIGCGRIYPQSKRAIDNHLSLFVAHASTFEGKPCTHIIFRSTPTRVAIASRLIHWFGGVVVANDSGDGDVTHRCKRRCPTMDSGVMPFDDKPWDDYNAALQKMRPLRKREIEAARKYAAYKEGY